MMALYVPLPVDKDGSGPAPAESATATLHQVWDAATNATLCTAMDEATARRITDALNASSDVKAALEQAAAICDSSAAQYADAAQMDRAMQDTADEVMAACGVEPVKGRPSGHDRARVFDRDAETCAVMARLIRKAMTERGL